MTINHDLIQDDFYQAVNESWLETAEIPDDKVSTGGFISVRDQIEELMMEEVEKMAGGDILVSQPEMQEFIKYYKQASDFSSRNEEGTEPIKKLIQKLFNRCFVLLLQLNCCSFFNFAECFRSDFFDFSTLKCYCF